MNLCRVGLLKWILRLLCSSLLVLKPIACVWHPSLFITAEISRKQRKLREFRRKKNIAHFHARSVEFCHFEQTQNASLVWATVTQCRSTHPNESLEQNGNISAKAQHHTVEVLRASFTDLTPYVLRLLPSNFGSSRCFKFITRY